MASLEGGTGFPVPAQGLLPTSGSTCNPRVSGGRDEVIPQDSFEICATSKGHPGAAATHVVQPAGGRAARPPWQPSFPAAGHLLGRTALAWGKEALWTKRCRPPIQASWEFGELGESECAFTAQQLCGRFSCTPFLSNRLLSLRSESSPFLRGQSQMCVVCPKSRPRHGRSVPTYCSRSGPPDTSRLGGAPSVSHGIRHAGRGKGLGLPGLPLPRLQTEAPTLWSRLDPCGRDSARCPGPGEKD